MTQHQINLSLASAAGLLLFSAVTTGAVGLLLPLDVPVQSRNSTATTPGGPRGAAPTTLPVLADFDPLFQRSLRRLAGDAPAPSAPVADSVPQTAPPPTLALVGFVGSSLAMIRTADGAVAIVSIGEEVDGAKLVAIRPTQVDLRSGDRMFTLEKPVDPANPPAPPMPARRDDPATLGRGY